MALKFPVAAPKALRSLAHVKPFSTTINEKAGFR